MSKISAVYTITHDDKPGYAYIGSSSNYDCRTKQHMYNLRGNKHHNVRLQRVFNKYGESGINFSYVVCKQDTDIREIEQQKIIEFIDNFGRERLWNMTLATKCPFDDPEVRARAMKSILANENNPEFVAKRNKAASEIITKLNSDASFRKASSDRIKLLNENPEFARKRDNAAAENRNTVKHKDKMRVLNTSKMLDLWKQDWFREKVSRAAAKTGANKDLRKDYLSSVRKSVICCTTGMEFESILSAANWVLGEGLSKSINSIEGCIRGVCNGKYLQAYGFVWSWL